MEIETKLVPLNIYRKAHAFIICCSYDNFQSLVNVKSWLNHIRKSVNSFGNITSEISNDKFSSTSKIKKPIFILCNKYDIKKRKFGDAEINMYLKEAAFSKDYKIKIYHKISARQSLNIDYIFGKLNKIILNQNKIINKGGHKKNLSTNLVVNKPEELYHTKRASKNLFLDNNERNDENDSKLSQSYLAFSFKDGINAELFKNNDEKNDEFVNTSLEGGKGVMGDGLYVNGGNISNSRVKGNQNCNSKSKSKSRFKDKDKFDSNDIDNDLLLNKRRPQKLKREKLLTKCRNTCCK